MKTGARHTSAQEERELATKKEELETLKRRLARLERIAANLRVDVGTIGRMYASVLAPRIRERDKLEERLSRSHDFSAKDSLKDEDAGETVFAGFPREDFSEEPVRDHNRPPEAGQAESFKELYRRVAKAIHPDLSTNEEEKKWRQRLMADANSAYASKDRKSLRTILQQWEGGPGRRTSGDLSAELAEILNKLLWVRERITVVEGEIEEIKRSDLYRLLEKVEEAHAEGIDLFDLMAGKLDEEIISFRELLQERARTGNREPFRPERSRQQWRRVCFPAEGSMGRLFTRRPGSESFLDWQSFGEARGTIEIPSGQALRLDIKGKRQSTNSIPGELAPDDLEALFLHGSNDLELSGVGGMTGLRELYLSGTGITDAGMAILPRLANLHRLYLYNTAVTDKGVETLKTLTGLRCITFCGAGITERTLNTLKVKLPGCRIIILNQHSARN